MPCKVVHGKLITPGRGEPGVDSNISPGVIGSTRCGISSVCKVLYLSKLEVYIVDQIFLIHILSFISSNCVMNMLGSALLPESLLC